MEDNDARKPENDAQMAMRLMSSLKHREESNCKKKRWILRRWPEKLQKRKKLDFLIEQYVPESDIREEKAVIGIMPLIQRSLNALYNDSEEGLKVGMRVIVPSSDFRLDKVQDYSDWELIRMSPCLLGYLNIKALRALLYALSGRHGTSKDRLIIQKQIQEELANTFVPSTETLPESLLNAAVILRDPKSLRHAFGLDTPCVKLFSQMPSSLLAAAHATFAELDKLPTRNLDEVHKMLMADCSTDLHLSFRRVQHSHGFTADMVRRKVSNLLSCVKEGDPLPVRIERALRVVSLSARDLYGDDGGLRQLLRPVTPEQESLEDRFLAALSHLEEMKVADLEKVYNIFTGAPENQRKRKHQIMYMRQLRGILTNSMHCIYAGTLPEPVARALSAINAGRGTEIDIGETIPEAREIKLDPSKNIAASKDIEIDPSKSMPTRETMKQERIGAEVEAVLSVSAQLQGMMWESYELFENNELVALIEGGSATKRASPQNLQDLSKDFIPTVADISMLDADRNHMEYDLGSDFRLASKHSDGGEEFHTEKFLEREVQQVLVETKASESHLFGIDRQEIVEEVERVADQAAIIAYVLVGHILEEISLLRSSFLDNSATEYLKMDLEDLQVSDGMNAQSNKSSRYKGADVLVLNTAKKLQAIPKCVLEKVQLRLGCSDG